MIFDCPHCLREIDGDTADLIAHLATHTPDAVFVLRMTAEGPLVETVIDMEAA